MPAPNAQIDAAFAALAFASRELRDSLAFGLRPGGMSDRFAEPLPWLSVMHEVFSRHHPVPAGVLVGWARRYQSRGRLTVWIGRRVWPYPLVLERAGLLWGSLFVDAKDANQRLWAAELALRSPAVGCVVADGGGFGMPATRRLQLVARESEALMLLSRPSQEELQLSAAGARWRVDVVRAPGDSPQWKIELLRCKGVRPVFSGSHGPSHPSWTLCWEAERASTRFIDTDVDHERDIHAPSPPAFAAAVPGGLPADLADRPSPAPPRARAG
jgi:hypothetical protein